MSRTLVRVFAASFVVEGVLAAMASAEWGAAIAAGCAVAAWTVLRWTKRQSSH